MKIRIITAVLLLSVGICFLFSADAVAQSKKLKVHEGTWDALVALAKQENKPILVEVFAPWCGYCKKLEKTTLKDREVISYINTHYIFAKIDAENASGIGPEMVQKYGIQGFPTMLLIMPDQTLKGRFSGYREPDKFIASLQKMEKPS